MQRKIYLQIPFIVIVKIKDVKKTLKAIGFLTMLMHALNFFALLIPKNP